MSVSTMRARCRSVVRALARRTFSPRDDRGDVPGWVLITIMTIGLVTVLWALAEDTLSGMFSEAMSAFGAN